MTQKTKNAVKQRTKRTNVTPTETQKTNAQTSETQTQTSDGKTTLDALFANAVDAHRRYADEGAPVSLFLVAFKRFHGVAKIERRARFASALRFFDEFARNAEQIETEEDAEGAWRPWVEGVETVARYDRALRASQTPPARSIEELLALGVPRPQIAKIYGFKRPDGSPDVDAVERREAWRAPSLPEDSPIEDDAAEIARLAVDALQKINESEGAPVDSETIERLQTIVDEATPDDESDADDEPNAEEVNARIDREILDGVPVRQIAARYGLDADAIKQRADALNVKPSSSASEVPPRLVQQIEARRADLASGQTTFADVARELSTSERALSVSELRRVLAQ